MLIKYAVKLIALPLKRSFREAKAEAAAIDAMIDRLSPPAKETYRRELLSRQKSIFAGYIFWVVGSHYAYTGQWARWVLYLGTFGGLLYWAMLDFVLMYHIIGRYNRKIARELLSKLAASVDLQPQTALHSAQPRGMIAQAQSRLAERRSS